MNKTMKILNLTQHKATPDQVDAGVIEPMYKQDITDQITFEDIPSKTDMIHRAQRIVRLTDGDIFDAVMIGGAPYFMSALEHELKSHGIEILYAFSKRDSVEVEKDGVVTKTMVFKHAGFVEV